MRTVTKQQLLSDFDRILAEAREACEPVAIEDGGETVAVFLSERDFSGNETTLHLMSSPANMSALLESQAQAERGEVVHVDWDRMKRAIETDEPFDPETVVISPTRDAAE